MTTPAGWYDDGSGRQRWWDGEQWTEHFALEVEAASADEVSPAVSETVAASASVDEQVTEAVSPWAEAADGGTPTIEDVDAADAAVAEPVAAGPVAEDSVAEPVAEDAIVAPVAEELVAEGSVAEGPVIAEPVSADSVSESPTEAPADPTSAAESSAQVWPTTTPDEAGIAASWTSEPAPMPDAAASAPAFSAPEAIAPEAAPISPSPAVLPPYAAPGFAATTRDYPGSAAPASGYPSAAPAYGVGTPAYAAAGYPGTGYPAYGAAPTGPVPVSILGLVGLGLAAVGTIMSCFGATIFLGWFLIFAGFVVSLISLFIRGRKWPGIAGIILSIVGTIVAVVMAIFLFVTSVSESIRDYPVTIPDSDTDDGSDGYGTDVEVVDGVLGEAVPLTQVDSTSELTITSATWSTTDGSSVPPTNDGYVTIDFTWTGVDGTTSVSPFYFMIETAEGDDGDYDYYADDQLGSAQLTVGESIDGRITFDVAQSDSYTVVVVNELFEPIARIAVTTAR